MICSVKKFRLGFLAAGLVAVFLAVVAVFVAGFLAGAFLATGFLAVVVFATGFLVVVILTPASLGNFMQTTFATSSAFFLDFSDLFSTA